MQSRIFGAASLAALLVIGLSACGGSEPQSGEQETAAAAPETPQLPADHPPVGQATNPNAMLPTPVMGEGASLSWSKPSEWVDEPPANPMRQAQFRVPGPEGDGVCVVYYFGAGQGGGPQANAERWADQFTQPDGSSSRERLTTEAINVNGLPALLVEVTGTYREGGMMMTGTPATERPGYMLKGAIVEGPDSNWFFKFTGPEETVRDNSDQFRALIESVQQPT